MESDCTDEIAEFLIGEFYGRLNEGVEQLFRHLELLKRRHWLARIRHC